VTPDPARLDVRRLRGTVPYGEALALQRAAHAARRAGTGPDVLLLLEHAPVVTLGPRTGAGDLVVPEEALRARGVEVVRTDRGGGVTYHGPGQAVGYPILDLRAWGLRPRDYLRFLEGLVAGVLAEWGLEAGTIEGRTGVWVGGAKVCALGVRVAGGVSMHGLALNVATDLDAFGAIVPCGIRDAGVTSLQRLLPRPPSVAEVMDRLAAAFLREAASRAVSSPAR
jgi:lipoyl(octanoyl) transferase